MTTTTTPTTYKVIRMYFSDDYATEVVSTGLTLEAAQAYCRDPQTSSSTCTDPEAVERTALRGAWFCGWTEDDDTLAAPADLDELFASDTQGLLDTDGCACSAYPEPHPVHCDGCSAREDQCVCDVPDGHCRVRVIYDRDLGEDFDTPARHEQTIDLPHWCSGDPAAGAALYLFGYADAVNVLHIEAEVIA